MGAPKSLNNVASTFFNTVASERPQAPTWGRQTCFLSRAPSNLVTPLVARSRSKWKTLRCRLQPVLLNFDRPVSLRQGMVSSVGMVCWLLLFLRKDKALWKLSPRVAKFFTTLGSFSIFLWSHAGLWQIMINRDTTRAATDDCASESFVLSRVAASFSAPHQLISEPFVACRLVLFWAKYRNRE